MLTNLFRRLNNLVPSRTLARRRPSPSAYFRPLCEVLEDRRVMATALFSIEEPPITLVEEGKNEVFNVKRTGDLSKSFTVDYEFSGTAKNGKDFKASGKLDFKAGVEYRSIFVEAKSDKIDEDDKEFFLTLTDAKATGRDSKNAVAGWGQQKVSGIIVDQNEPPIVTLTGRSNPKAKEGSTQRFAVRLSEKSDKEVTVSYHVSGGNSPTFNLHDTKADVTTPMLENGEGKLVFKPGEKVKYFDIKLNDDKIAEPNESFNIRLTTIANTRTLSEQIQHVVIEDNDIPVVAWKAGSDGDRTVLEGNAGTKSVTLTMQSSLELEKELFVNYATAKGTAQAGSGVENPDYVHIPVTSVKLSADKREHSVDFQIVGDTNNADGDVEFFHAVIFNSPDNSYRPGTSHGKIAKIYIANDDDGDNDNVPLVSVGGALGNASTTTISEPSGGSTKPASVFFTLFQPAQFSFTAYYKIGNRSTGTAATEGSDFTIQYAEGQKPGEVTFKKGKTVAEFDLKFTIFGGGGVEGNEDIFVELLPSPTGDYEVMIPAHLILISD